MRDIEQAYEELRRRRGEGLFAPLRKMLSGREGTLMWRPRFAPDYGICSSPECSVEGCVIEPGDTVLYDGTGRQVHEDCEPPE